MVAFISSKPASGTTVCSHLKPSSFLYYCFPHYSQVTEQLLEVRLSAFLLSLFASEQRSLERSLAEIAKCLFKREAPLIGLAFTESSIGLSQEFLEFGSRCHIQKYFERRQREVPVVDHCYLNFLHSYSGTCSCLRIGKHFSSFKSFIAFSAVDCLRFTGFGKLHFRTRFDLFCLSSSLTSLRH